MFKKILVGIDEAPHARDAAALGERLAQACGGASLELVAAYQDPLLPFPPTFAVDPHRERDARTALTAVRTSCAPSARTLTVPDVSPSRALRRIARKEAADLIVLGSERDTLEGSARAGRLGRQVLHNAPCAIAFAAVGAHARPALLRTIVVAVDETPESQAALDVACGLAEHSGASVTAVSVVDDRWPVNYTPWGEMAAIVDWESLTVQRREYRHAALEQLLAGRAVAVELRVGQPTGELVAASEGADLLVVGSRHWGALGRVAIGSTSEALCRGARSSILVVPRAEG
jgi:nucleotide-binding universal stress UspA family protein